jgi:hypothetical protein
MAVKREDERYSSDPLDEVSGIVEHVERKQEEGQEQDGGAPGFRMKVTGDSRDDGKRKGHGR